MRVLFLFVPGELGYLRRSKLLNMRWMLLLAAFGISTLSSNAQQLISISSIDTTPKIQINFIASGMAMYDVANFKVLYYTSDVDGQQSVASGMLSVPVTTCNHFSLVSYNHGTVSEREEVPSRGVFESMLGKVFASRGYVTVMPDYLGLGDSPGLHPYLHEETQATATLDMIRAVREAVTDGTVDYPLNGEILLTGYSQGGHAAMGTAKYIADMQLESEFNVIATAPASGPYNLAGSQAQVFIDDVPYSNPGYVVYLLLGMNEAYGGSLFASPSDILKSPYDTLVPPYFDGSNDMTTINALLPAQASGYLVDTMLQAFTSDSIAQQHWLWQMLNENTNFDWSPSHPMRLHYCTQDEQVEYQNSLDAEAAMSANGVQDVQAINNGPFNHFNCVLPSMTGVVEFFDSVSTTCGEPSSVESTPAKPVTIYPNPTSNSVFFSGVNGVLEVEVYNAIGVSLMTKVMAAQQGLDLGTFPRGNYLLRVTRNGVTENHWVVLE